MVKLLVIDDSNFQRSSLARKLTKLGYEVVEASNGKDGLAMIDQGKFDCILSDLHMPEMGGVELLQQLSQRRSYPPVIVISADIQEETQEEISGLGCRGFLTKPIKIELLEKAIKEVLST